MNRTAIHSMIAASSVCVAVLLAVAVGCLVYSIRNQPRDRYEITTYTYRGPYDTLSNYLVIFDRQEGVVERVYSWPGAVMKDSKHKHTSRPEPQPTQPSQLPSEAAQSRRMTDAEVEEFFRKKYPDMYK